MNVRAHGGPRPNQLSLTSYENAASRIIPILKVRLSSLMAHGLNYDGEPTDIVSDLVKLSNKRVMHYTVI